MNQRFGRRAIAVGFAISGLLAGAACGGDDSGDDATPTTAASATTADSATTTADGATTTAGGATVPGLAAGCQELAQEFATALGGAVAPTADEATISDAFGRLEANVPADLQDDVHLVGELLGTYAQAYAKVGNDPAKVATDPDVLAALQELSKPEYTAATQAISAYFTGGCQTG